MATRTIANGGGNYNSTGTWVEGAVPTGVDDVVATATSGALTVTAAASCKTLILTGYTSTLTINSGYTLNANGSITLASGMTFAGSGTLAIGAEGTMTANGITVTGGLSLLASGATVTLADNWVVSGLLTLAGAGTFVTTNGYQVTANGGVTCLGVATGTTVIILAGTGTWTGSATIGRYCGHPITINASGSTITLATDGPQFGNTTVTYTAGTIVSTGSTIRLNGTPGNVTFTGAFPALGSIIVVSTVTLTCNNNLALGDTLRVAEGISLTLAGAVAYSCATLQVDSAATLKLPNSQTITVSTAIVVSGTVFDTTTISSTTASTSSTLTYNGTQANMKVAWCTFTDIAATNPLWNHWGGTLTRTSGITNTSYTPGDYSDPGEAQVATGTSYLYQGATKNGSYAGGGSTVIVIED